MKVISKRFLPTENYSSVKVGDGIAFYLKDNNFKFFTKIAGVYTDEFTFIQPIDTIINNS